MRHDSNEMGRATAVCRRLIRAGACLFAGAVLLSATGCSVHDHLTINADGTGSVVIETRVPGGMGDAPGMMPWMGQVPPQHAYPPVSEDMAEKLFPGESFDVQVDSEGGEDVRTVRVAVEFTDINALLQSPYGKAHSLQLQRGDGQLRLRAKSGMVAATMLEEQQGQMGMMMPGLGGDEVTDALQDYRVTFQVTLPGAAASEDGQVEGRSVTWTADRGELGSVDATRDALGRTLSASCPDAGVTFDPVQTMPLDLDHFADLAEGRAGPEAEAVDSDAILAAAKVMPVMTTVTRSFDLVGEGGWMENEAALLVAVKLPRELKPLRYGEVEVEAITDDTGASLIASEDEHMGMHRHFHGGWFGMGEEQDQAEASHLVTIPMKLPDREATALANVTATLPMSYTGTPYVVKLPDAISDVSGGGMRMHMDGSGGVTHEKLEELGVSLNLMGAMRQQGGTMLMLEVESGTGAVEALQVFDKDGRPWPTIYVDQPGMSQTVVLGEPEPPLSLAVRVVGGGSGVRLPIELTDLPITPNELDEAEAQAEAAP